MTNLDTKLAELKAISVSKQFLPNAASDESLGHR
jgi:hypothetical protein